MNFETNDLFGQMLGYFLKCYKSREKARIINIGGSRSGKTLDTGFLLCYLSDKYKIHKKKRPDGTYDNILSENGEENLIIDVYRNELKKTRKTYEDFLLCISLMGISKQVTMTSVNSDRPSVTFPNGNQINFYGLPDDGKIVEGSKSHIVYFNEALEISARKIIANITMRCEMMEIYDSNPSVTTHFLFDMGKEKKDVISTNTTYKEKKEVLFTHTTYKDNKFLPKTLIDGLEEMCPWDLSDYVLNPKTGKYEWALPENQRKPNVKNIENKTADRRLWLIYGEGLRCARDGAAFNPIWIKDFPTDVQFDTLIYGLDFGWTNDETALSRIGISGKDIYVKLLYYRQCPKSDLLFSELEPILMKEELYIGGETPSIDVVCESQDNKNGDYFVSSLGYQKKENHPNWHFFKVKKPKFRAYSVDLVNLYNLHVVRTPETEKELLNFVYEERNGELTAILHGATGRNNHDHFIDSFLYAIWEVLKHKITR